MSLRRSDGDVLARWPQWIAAAAVLVAALWFLGGLEALQQCTDGTVYGPTHQPHHHDFYTNRVMISAGAGCIGGFVSRYSGFFLVVLTAILARYTYRLWKDSGEAVQAAVLHAQAAVRVHGPFVEVRKFDSFPQQSIPKSGGSLVFGLDHDWGFDLHNFGEMAAFVTDIWYGASYGDEPSFGKVLEAHYTPDSPIAIPAHEVFRCYAPGSRLKIDLDEARRPDGKRDQVWVWVIIRYYDKLGVVAEVGCLARRLDKGIHLRDGYSQGTFQIQRRQPFTYRRYDYTNVGSTAPFEQADPDGG